MEYTPQAEREIRNAMVLPPGIYDFEIAKAVEKTSKAGNDMIELTVRVFPADGGAPRLVRDWLVGGASLGELKINRFCHATGLEGTYFNGKFGADVCEGAAGKCKTTVAPSEKYGEQCSIKDYLPVSSTTPEEAPAAAQKESAKASAKKKAEPTYEDKLAAANDDIPF